MKSLLSVLVVLGLFLTAGFSRRESELFQVISSHPHDVLEFQPYVQTVYQNGRLWVVKLAEDMPVELLRNFRPLKGHERSYLFEGMFFSNARLSKTDPVKKVVNEIEKDFIKKDVEHLAHYETRAAGTPQNREALKFVSERFKSLGYAISEVCYSASACSIVAEKKGSKSPDKVMMVMGHIDSVGHSFAGADDNASGTAVVLEMARVLKSSVNKKTLRFFVTNGEELGLLGATYYAKWLQTNNQLKNLSLVINMDMVGYNSNGIVELETEPEHEELAKWFANLASRYTTLKTKITLGAWGSDHVPFLQKGVPSILTIEDWDTKTPCYHLECDTPDTLNYEYAAQIAKLNTAAVLMHDQ